jgi:peroxiredoxin|tara:strand:- start:36 stop:728 length:693 start_codon:yes stop_codon:yes gene_type:complete
MRFIRYQAVDSLNLPAMVPAQGRDGFCVSTRVLDDQWPRLDLLNALQRLKHACRYHQALRRLALGLALASFLISLPAATLAEGSLSAGMRAPDFELANLLDDTERRALKDYSGQVVYLDFWASWCGPCLVAMPKIEALRQTIDSDEFVVLAINVDRNLKKARKFLTKIGVGYDSLVDEQGRVSASYGLNAMPSSFVINRGGVVTKVHEGFRDGDEDELRVHIKAVIDSGA